MTLPIDLLYALHGLALSHREGHWLAKGVHFYPNHLLLGELYDSASKEIDELAERILGTIPTAEAELSAERILAQATLFLNSLPPEGDVMARALKAELAYLGLLGQVELPSRGWEDLIGAHCSAHERAVYLLSRNQA